MLNEGRTVKRLFCFIYVGVVVACGGGGGGDGGGGGVATPAPPPPAPSAPDSGAVYVFAPDAAAAFAQQAYIKASNPDERDGFGSQVTLSGDTLAVGARQEDSNATGIDGDQSDNSAADSGAVYVFTRNAGVWSQQNYVKASNTDAGDAFGTSIAISIDTLVVAANLEDSAATGIDGDQSSSRAASSGAVYAFSIADTNFAAISVILKLILDNEP